MMSHQRHSIRHMVDLAAGRVFRACHQCHQRHHYARTYTRAHHQINKYTYVTVVTLVTVLICKGFSRHQSVTSVTSHGGSSHAAGL